MAQCSLLRTLGPLAGSGGGRGDVSPLPRNHTTLKLYEFQSIPCTDGLVQDHGTRRRAVAIDQLATAGAKHSLWPYVCLGGLIAAPFLVRIDGILISGGAAAFTLYRLTGAKRWVAPGVAAVFVVANLGALFWVYGGQFPDSMTAKGGAGVSELGWLLGFCRAMVTASPLLTDHRVVRGFSSSLARTPRICHPTRPPQVSTNSGWPGTDCWDSYACPFTAHTDGEG